MDLVAFVFMPEHVHLLVYPRLPKPDLGLYLSRIKQPFSKQIKQQLAQANIDPKMLKRQEAIISSMTPKERRNPDLINASRKKRIASGSGTSVPEVNRVLKQWKQMSVMMKKVKKLGKTGLMRAGLQGIMPRF